MSLSLYFKCALERVEGEPIKSVCCEYLQIAFFFLLIFLLFVGKYFFFFFFFISKVF